MGLTSHAPSVAGNMSATRHCIADVVTCCACGLIIVCAISSVTWTVHLGACHLACWSAVAVHHTLVRWSCLLLLIVYPQLAILFTLFPFYRMAAGRLNASSCPEVTNTRERDDMTSTKHSPSHPHDFDTVMPSKQSCKDTKPFAPFIKTELPTVHRPDSDLCIRSGDVSLTLNSLKATRGFSIQSGDAVVTLKTKEPEAELVNIAYVDSSNLYSTAYEQPVFVRNCFQAMYLIPLYPPVVCVATFLPLTIGGLLPYWYFLATAALTSLQLYFGCSAFERRLSGFSLKTSS